MLDLVEITPASGFRVSARNPSILVRQARSFAASQEVWLRPFREAPTLLNKSQ
jgi:hypothetical protein